MNVMSHYEEAILNFEISDDVLEKAAGLRREKQAAYTMPSAIICIPLGPARSKD
jgi:hypothetical protein